MDPAAIKHEIKTAIIDSQQSMLDTLESMINSKLQSFQQHSIDLSEAQIGRIQAEIMSQDTVKFNRKSCEDQYKFNSKVSVMLKEADRELENGNFSNAKSKIAEGIDFLAYRQKLVKMADSSELGWKVVQEYVANPLAENSDDEKRINRAYSAASRKMKVDRRRKRFNPLVKPQGDKPAQDRIKPGVCYRCMKPGHWARECTEKENKISTNLIYLNSENLNVQYVCKPITETYQVGPIEPDPNIRERKGELVSSRSNEFHSNIVNSPVGRLKSAINKWKLSDTSDYILNAIDRGYGLPFKVLPESVVLKNNRSSVDNKDFVEEEITRLLNLGCISEVEKQEVIVVNPLTVAVNRKGKKRMVLYCRHINPCLNKFKCKFEDSSVAKQLFKQGYFLFKFDLKSAYHHISILPDHRKYLGFKWNLGGCDKYFVFNVLAFGISTAGFIFTKLVKELVKLWRSKGHKVVVYLDDGQGGASSIKHARDLSIYVHDSLIDHGFLIAEDKCIWEPVSVIVWLGLIWNTTLGKVFITQERVERLVDMLTCVVTDSEKGKILFSVKHIACMVGQVISMQAAIGNLVRLRTRELYKCILLRSNWHSLVPLSNRALDELMFWRDSISRLNTIGRCITEVDLCDVHAYSDASGTGYGGFIEMSQTVDKVVDNQSILNCNCVSPDCVVQEI